MNILGNNLLLTPLSQRGKLAQNVLDHGCGILNRLKLLLQGLFLFLKYVQLSKGISYGLDTHINLVFLILKINKKYYNDSQIKRTIKIIF